MVVNQCVTILLSYLLYESVCDTSAYDYGRRAGSGSIATLFTAARDGTSPEDSSLAGGGAKGEWPD